MEITTIPPKIGKYNITRPLGRGGMGQVYLAEDTKLQRQVAIKCLRPELEDPQWQERLKQEALVLARLNHPNIVQIHDIVEFDDSVAIVTEYIEGRNLHILLRERNPSYTERVQWLAEISAGLAAAHKQGISHNDLKPENILIGTGNVAKINDFGIASTDTDLSEDILALGEFVRSLVGDLPEHSPLIDHLLKRMLDRKPAKRPGAAEVADELRYIWLEATQSETPLPPGLEPKSSRSGKVWLAIGTLTALALALLVYVNFGEKPEEPHKYVAVLPTRLDIDEKTDSKQYALLASSIEQGFYQAIMDANGYSLVSPAETGQHTGSPSDIGVALKADEVIVPQLKCRHQHCEMITERMVGPEYRVQMQRSTALLPELTLEAFQIAARQWGYLYNSSVLPDKFAQSISESDYRTYLDLYEGAHHGTMPLDAVLAELDKLFQKDIRFLPASLLYVFAAMEHYDETGNDQHLRNARNVMQQTDRWAGDSVLLHKSWFDLELESGNYDSAEYEIATLEKLGADEALTMALKGKFHRYKGEYDIASDYYTRALKLRPAKDTYSGAAHNYYHAGEPSKALELVNAAISQFSYDGTMFTLKGLILLDRGDLEAATEAFQTALLIRPTTAEHNNLGLAYLLSGKYDQALIELNYADELAGRMSFATSLNVADTLLLQGRKEEAGKHYRELLQRIRETPGSVPEGIESQVLAHLGDFQQAIQLLDSAKAKNAETSFSAALVYTLAGQSLAATAKVYQALDANMGFIWFRLPWFDALCQEPDFVTMMTEAGDAERCGSQPILLTPVHE